MNILSNCFFVVLSSIFAMYNCLGVVVTPEEIGTINTDIVFFVDNVPVNNDVLTCYSDDNLLVPANLISEELGASIDWNEKQISIKGQNIDIVLYTDKNEANVNGIKYNLSTPSQVIQSQLFVPLRFVAESLNARILYRDQKVFIYSSQYNDLFAYGIDVFNRNNRIFFLEDGQVKEKQCSSDKISVLPITDKVDSLLAVSNSGIVYACYLDIMYYNLSTQKTTKLFDIPGYAYRYTPFDSNGSFYVVDDAISKQSYNKSDNLFAEYYMAVFSVDIDGTNKKEIFVADANYDFWNLQLYDGWIYYISKVPVVKSYGIDYYSGGLYRVHTNGNPNQKLTEENINTFYITRDGIHYEYGSDSKKGFLRFADMK